MEKLTPKQKEVLDHLASGKKNKEIGLIMGVGETTIKAHLTVIFEKTFTTNRTELIVKFLRGEISGAA